MSTISTLYALVGYGAVFAVMLLARLDYRALRRRPSEDWDSR